MARRRAPSVPSHTPNFTPSVQRVAPAGRQPQNRPLIDLNNRRLALLAMLPFNYFLPAGRVSMQSDTSRAVYTGLKARVGQVEMSSGTKQCSTVSDVSRRRNKLSWQNVPIDMRIATSKTPTGRGKAVCLFRCEKFLWSPEQRIELYVLKIKKLFTWSTLVLFGLKVKHLVA